MSHSNPLSGKKILLQVTGSISAFKAVALCSKLVQAGARVEVALSNDAFAFIGAASFEGLTRRAVHRGNFDEGRMMAHIDLERWADAMLVYPCTAHTLNGLAHGRGDSLIGALFLAHEFKKPYWIAPAMNQAMLDHPATKEAITKLRSWGIRVFDSESGFLACGEVGGGRLVEADALLEALEAHFSASTEKPVSRKSILITSGGTLEPIDAIRSITNFSTGETGHRLALAFEAQGHSVTLLQSKHSKFITGVKNPILYDTTEDFAAKLKHELETHSFDEIIHAAAVADYSVEAVSNLRGVILSQSTKIQGDEDLMIRLRPNPKLIKNVRLWSKNPQIRVISFKLTHDPSNDKKLETYDSEWIVHNYLKDVAGARHVGTLFKRTSSGKYEEQASFKTKNDLAAALSKIVGTETGEP